MSNKEVSLHEVGSNRIGKIDIHDDVKEQERFLLGSLLHLCTVLEAWRHESGRGTSYLLASNLFQPLGEGEEVPTYRIEFDHPAKPIANRENIHEFVESINGFKFRAVRKLIVRVPPASVHAKTHQIH